MIKILAASVIGAALAGGLTFGITTWSTNASADAEPVNESLYNYGDR
ncbi:hypothetical protein CLV63_109163 [Murinocardiopsis flavida]|uniref:Uncharacterized protein n=1 Tax=Murinocardiopsis flavida TaxID=645275 RepID=A0A2P8DJ13_9ACTN|nr:hypothetical protein [Murinocardiopsis flavida]PSK97159.1 hypothetical protein CLV63_109163 [Murinocardiopsis flavida]